MNAIESLKSTADSFGDLEGISEMLVGKFLRTEYAFKKSEGPCSEDVKESSYPDIIDLLYDINSRLKALQDRISSNVDRVVNMID